MMTASCYFCRSVVRAPLLKSRSAVRCQSAAPPGASDAKLVLEVKERLARENPGLPTGRNGRDDDDMVLWFLKDRKFSVDEAVSKLTKTQDPVENQKLCAYLVEKAVSRLPSGAENILGIFDLRGFRVENGDLQFLKFLIDVFYYYYPKRLGQVLFVDAPFVFQPMWQVVKPLLKSYASLVRFCDAETVRKEYFKEETVPLDFRN
ncbi:phosphatidylinositol transfer protein CSR1-like isoform X3 [Miscanthus floridulus]|uniref:phosphatidylinositol transfer protein CSR1-like isoform X3 n=1 Tax=Miscanthus floridulus TaxID=154761 RepID=UPI003458E72D